MRNYYPKYAEVSKGVYNQVKGILMDCDRLRRERLDILYGTPKRETGMPSAAGTGRPAEQKAIALEEICGRLDGIDQACMAMRGWLGQKVCAEFNPIKAYWSYDYFNCCHTRAKAEGIGPTRRTWIRYKHRFTAAIAKNLKLF